MIKSLSTTKKKLVNTYRFIASVAIGLGVFSTINQAFSATDNWGVDGENGTLYVHGTLLEGACEMEMASDWQRVDLMQLSANNFSRPGDTGEPVNFTIKLKNCARTGGVKRSNLAGGLTEDSVQPVVSITFNGVTGWRDQSLLQVAGATGIALRIKDPLGRLVKFGMPGEALVLNPGDNILNYVVYPVRTPDPLRYGKFLSITNFEISYE